MTDRAYRAKCWLNRNYNLNKQVEADQRMLEILQDRLGSGVAKYESDGTECHDSDAARKRHEDILLELSQLRERYEREKRQLVEETAKTRKAIGELQDPAQRAVAVDRYINRLKWENIAELEHIAIAQVYRLNSLMLEQMANVLDHFGGAT